MVLKSRERGIITKNMKTTPVKVYDGYNDARIVKVSQGVIEGNAFNGFKISKVSMGGGVSEDIRDMKERNKIIMYLNPLGS